MKEQQEDENTNIIYDRNYLNFYMQPLYDESFTNKQYGYPNWE